MSEDSIDYGNWVPKKLIIIILSLIIILTVVAVIPFYFVINIILWIIDGFLIICAIYFIPLYRAFSANNGELQNQIRNIVIEKLQWDGKGRALDIGTGSGYLAIHLAKPNPNSEVIGIDYWGKSWNFSKNICEKNAKIEGVKEQTEFQRASAVNLPFEDEYFDAIVSNLVFHNILSVRDKSELFKEALRVLKKGGVFSIQDKVKSKKLYGDFNQLKKKIKEIGVAELNYIDTNFKTKIPRSVRIELKTMGIFHGRK